MQLYSYNQYANIVGMPVCIYTNMKCDKRIVECCDSECAGWL